MEDVDDLILKHISSGFKTVKEISDELHLPYVRVAVRIRGFRKRRLVISIQSNKPHIKGVKPLMYKSKS